jgi:hypothetical protein
MLQLRAVDHATGELLELQGTSACRQALLDIGVDPTRVERLLHQSQSQGNTRARQSTWCALLSTWGPRSVVTV